MTRKPINAYVGTPQVYTQRPSQILAERIEIALCLLNLGELLCATSFLVQVHGQLVGAGATDEVGKVVELGRGWGLRGLLRDWSWRGDGPLFKSLGLMTELRQERAGLADGEEVR